MTQPKPLDFDPELALLIPKLFIARKDVKAWQVSHGDRRGEYRPDRSPWKVGDIRQHLAGDKTFGHYVCDSESQCKVIVFDIDLEKSGTWVERPDLSTLPADASADAVLEASTVVHPSEPRSDWHDRRHPGRAWYKLQLRTMVELLASAVHAELEIPTAAFYTGNKGCHVYGFFSEPVHASEARAGAFVAMERAALTMDPAGEFKSIRGKNFYGYSDPSPVTGFENLSIEVFPKQDSMEDKDLGNLVRLPLGRNWKHTDPTFLIDQRAPHTELRPRRDVAAVLKSGNPWRD